MDEILQFEQFSRNAWLLLTLLPVAGLIVYSLVRRRTALERFAKLETLRSIVEGASEGRRILKGALVTVAVLAIVVTLWRPQGNPTVEKVRAKGRDIVFLLDVSKSMLATDLVPDRLERAKLMIEDVVSEMEGDRVGLVVFAGSASLRCPLTHNHFAFRTHLRRVTVDTIARGGTNIGDAIRVATERLYRGVEGSYKDIILITDGDDQDSFPVQAAEDAVRQGIRLFTVGLGNPQGTRLRGVRYKGEVVISGLNEDLLREIAFTHPEGRYVKVATGSADLGQLYRASIATAEQGDGESRETKVWSEWYQAPLALAILLLAVEWFVSERKRIVARPGLAMATEGSRPAGGVR